jgi:hypothetical protein
MTRISELDVCGFRALTRRTGAGLTLALRGKLPNAMFTPSWEFFPLELGDPGDDVVALVGYADSLPPLNPRLEWLAIEHQSGGHACSHPRFVGIRLTLRPQIKPGLRAISVRFRGYRHGYFGRGKAASDIALYRSMLVELGLDCEWAHPMLEEAVYPIDASPENLGILSATPPRLEGLTDGAARLPESFAIFLLARNSD